jgi:glycosyl-4,4'-diaponeurosporenoate acyltransferase
MVIQLIAIDLLLIVGISVGFGALAPRIPRQWLLPRQPRLTRWESDSGYRKLRAPSLARRLPELGSVFGGRSKSALPGTSEAHLLDYLVEVRRAEIVHIVSALSWLPLLAFNPWWLTLAFASIVLIGNALFLIVLRFNRVRLIRLLNRLRNDPPAGASGGSR